MRQLPNGRLACFLNVHSPSLLIQNKCWCQNRPKRVPLSGPAWFFIICLGVNTIRRAVGFEIWWVLAELLMMVFVQQVDRYTRNDG